jgi:hypothetical protein
LDARAPVTSTATAAVALLARLTRRPAHMERYTRPDEPATKVLPIRHP